MSSRAILCVLATAVAALRLSGLCQHRCRGPLTSAPKNGAIKKACWLQLHSPSPKCSLRQGGSLQAGRPPRQSNCHAHLSPAFAFIGLSPPLMVESPAEDTLPVSPPGILAGRRSTPHCEVSPSPPLLRKKKNGRSSKQARRGVDQGIDSRPPGADNGERTSHASLKLPSGPRRWARAPSPQHALSVTLQPERFCAVITILCTHSRHIGFTAD